MNFPRLSGKKVLLGVTGGIAAYKAAELVRLLRKSGADVRVIMTGAAQEFITPLTLQVLSGNRVGTELFEPGYESEIGHIELARWAEIALIAPATADFIARFRLAMANDLLTTVLLATRAPVLVCPSMNTQMYRNVAVQENLQALASRAGVEVLAPGSGELACKEVGEGRLPELSEILASAERLVSVRALNGVHVVVTAGPTREYFDPVRFISNPSTGKMGFALAAAAAAAGADVTLIAGPVALETPPNVTRIDVVTAADMLAAVERTTANVLLMCAAVADHVPTEFTPEKQKKTEGPWTPSLMRSADILQKISHSESRPQVVVGFAAETENAVDYARGKLSAKNLDAIVANYVGPGGAFGNDLNQVFWIDRFGRQETLGPSPKRDIADQILDRVTALWAGEHHD